MTNLIATHQLVVATTKYNIGLESASAVVDADGNLNVSLSGHAYISYGDGKRISVDFGDIVNKIYANWNGSANKTEVSYSPNDAGSWAYQVKAISYASLSSPKSVDLSFLKDSIVLDNASIPILQNGKQGLTGPTFRGPIKWADCPDGFQFMSGVPGDQFRDFIVYTDGQYYYCIKDHVKSATNYPNSAEDKANGYWRLGDRVPFTATDILLSAYALIKNLGVENVEMKDKDGNVVFVAKDGNVTCNSGIFKNITAEGTFTSTNPTTMNSIEINANEGYIRMLGPDSVDDEHQNLPGPSAKQVELMRLSFETDADTLTRVAVLTLSSKYEQIVIDPRNGFGYVTDNGSGKWVSWNDFFSKF